MQRRNRGLMIALAVALLAVALAICFHALAQTEAKNAEESASRAQKAYETARASTIDAENARATAQANLSLAQQKLDELRVEALLTSARTKKDQLDANGAIAGYTAAAEAASARGKVLDVYDEITDTLRYVATAYVQEGEKILCETISGQGLKCAVPLLGQAATSVTAPAVAGVPIPRSYLTWAEAAAPQLTGWSQDLVPVQRQAIISATALFSQALALQPPADTPLYIWIPPGNFTMGSTSDQCRQAGLGECYREELPSHPVTLGAYWLQRTEITNGQYKRCYASGACTAPLHESSYWELDRWSRFPVTHLDWNQAHAYALWVGGRLPTEEEWEYACRGTENHIYPWGSAAPDTTRANFQGEVNATTEVGSYEPGLNDLYDMAGNTAEWTYDLYIARYDNSAADNSNATLGGNEERTLRGGAWDDNGDDMRCAQRRGNIASSAGNGVGFRVLAPALSQP